MARRRFREAKGVDAKPLAVADQADDIVSYRLPKRWYFRVAKANRHTQLQMQQ